MGPRNSRGMFARKSVRGPYCPIFRLLLCWTEDSLKVPGLVGVEGGDHNELGAFCCGRSSLAC